MRRADAIVTLLALTTAVAAAPGADLSAIDRTVRKEPAYKGQPRYCLLVFGPEAKARVWLVLDGDTLYVDRNGNGDLTEPGEKVAAEATEAGSATYRHFVVETLTDGALTHRNLQLTVMPLDRM